MLQRSIALIGPRVNQRQGARELATDFDCSGEFQGLASYGGNVYVVGQRFDNFFEDCASGASQVVGALMKFDSSGNLLWTRRIKGEGEGLGFAAFTSAGAVWASETGVHVGGNLTTTFPGHVADGPSMDSSECPPTVNQFRDKLDAYVRSYDFDGNVIWTHQFGSNVFDIVNSIGTDATGVFVVGDTDCRIDNEEMLSGAFGDAFFLRMAIEPTSLPGKVQLIVGQIETLRDKQRLNQGEFNSLMKHLEAALVAALQTDARPAARQALKAFVGEVGVMMSRDTLSESEGGALVAAANDVIALT